MAIRKLNVKNMSPKKDLKVLLLDTNVSSYPIYQYLVNEGYDVYVAGSNANDFLAKCAKKYFEIDYSNQSSLIELVKENQINYLVPGCNDISYKACILLNSDGRFHGLESFETNEILNNKNKFRDFAMKNKLPTPKVYSKKEINEFNLPLIIKPTDAFSGKGITVIRETSKDSLNTAVSNAIVNSRSKSYVIEEFVTGQLYSHSAFLSNKKIIQDFFVEENCIANPFAVDTSRVARDLSASIIGAVRVAVELIAATLNLVDGLLHTQFMSNEDSIWLIEPTRRCPGDLYSRLIELSTGFNYVENYTRPFLGLDHSRSKDDFFDKLVFRHTITLPKSDNFWTFKNNHKINILEFIPLALAGDYICAAPKGRIGIIFATSNCEIEFNTAYNASIKRTLYDIK
jgi:predicted ATP-grasp superfamily ATP-dependent carboligase